MTRTTRKQREALFQLGVGLVVLLVLLAALWAKLWSRSPPVAEEARQNGGLFHFRNHAPMLIP